MVYFFILMAGLTLSSLLIAELKIHFLTFLFSLIGNSLFFGYIYLAKLKELPPDKAIKYRNILQFAMYLFSLLIWILFSFTASSLYVVIAVYLWYLNKNFFIEKWLKRKIFLKKFLSHVVIIPMTVFPYSLERPETFNDISLISYSLLAFFTFLLFEFCHQMNPFDPKNPKYIHFYGYKRIFYYCSILLLLSAMCTSSLGFRFLLWPLQCALFIALCILYFDFEKSRFVEACSEIYAQVTIWSVVIYSLYQVYNVHLLGLI